MKNLSKIDSEGAVNSAAAAADVLVAREEVKLRSRMLAYERVAGWVNRSPSWIRNLIKYGGTVPGEIERRFDELLFDGIEAQLERFEADLDLAKKSPVHPARHRVVEIQAHIQRLRALLDGGVQ